MLSQNYTPTAAPLVADKFKKSGNYKTYDDIDEVPALSNNTMKSKDNVPSNDLEALKLSNTFKQEVNDDHNDAHLLNQHNYSESDHTSDTNENEDLTKHYLPNQSPTRQGYSKLNEDMEPKLDIINENDTIEKSIFEPRDQTNLGLEPSPIEDKLDTITDNTAFIHKDKDTHIPITNTTSDYNEFTPNNNLVTKERLFKSEVQPIQHKFDTKAFISKNYQNTKDEHGLHNRNDINKHLSEELPGAYPKNTEGNVLNFNTDKEHGLNNSTLGKSMNNSHANTLFNTPSNNLEPSTHTPLNRGSFITPSNILNDSTTSPLNNGSFNTPTNTPASKSGFNNTGKIYDALDERDGRDTLRNINNIEHTNRKVDDSFGLNNLYDDNALACTKNDKTKFDEFIKNDDLLNKQGNKAAINHSNKDPVDTSKVTPLGYTTTIDDIISSKPLDSTTDKHNTLDKGLKFNEDLNVNNKQLHHNNGESKATPIGYTATVNDIINDRPMKEIHREHPTKDTKGLKFDEKIHPTDNLLYSNNEGSTGVPKVTPTGFNTTSLDKNITTEPFVGAHNGYNAKDTRGPKYNENIGLNDSHNILLSNNENSVGVPKVTSTGYNNTLKDDNISPKPLREVYNDPNINNNSMRSSISNSSEDSNLAYNDRVISQSDYGHNEIKKEPLIKNDNNKASSKYFTNKSGSNNLKESETMVHPAYKLEDDKQVPNKTSGYKKIIKGNINKSLGKLFKNENLIEKGNELKVEGKAEAEKANVEQSGNL